MINKINWVFFGTDEFAVTVLNTLAIKGIVPSLVITTPDAPKGRHLTLTPPPVKDWANERQIKVIQPEKLKDELLKSELEKSNFDLFIVASYGKIIPEMIFNIPKHKTLNIHPSLLPKFRGASPVSTAILEDTKDNGVTIMQIDEGVDHGPIVAQEKYHVGEWLPREEIETTLATIGANLLAKTIPDYINGKIKPAPQDDSKASYTKMVEKSDAEINLNDDPYLNFRKIMAYSGWPKAFTFFETANTKVRAQITEANFVNGELIIEKVIPEGKKEMNYEDFKRGLR